VINPQGQTRAAPLAESTRCLYVYGLIDRVVSAEMLFGATRGTELTTTAVGRVAAVHTDADPREFDGLAAEVREGSRLAELARHHDEVVTALALAGPVLPMRLGTLVPDEQLLARLLEDAHTAIVDGLERVRGRAEWELRVARPADGGREPGAAAQPRGSGTAYLQSRRAARDRGAAADAAVQALDEALSFWADAAAGSPMAHPPVARVYLVGDSAHPDFLAAGRQGIAELAALGCTAELRGPRPAYSFADVQLGGAEDD
jgi:Gas vesicle synthesis protein GvpL/GvpF